MAVTCSACGYDKNPDGTEFCDACGSEISDSIIAAASEPEVPKSPVTEKPVPYNPTVVSEPLDTDTTTAAYREVPVYEPPAEPYSPPSVPPVVGSATSTTFAASSATARLIAKQVGAPTPEFVIDNGSAIVGIFDPDTGPVEIDLEGFAGDETVSRSHAEIYQEGTAWKVKDLGSTNGVFIKPAGQSRFASRITLPTVINAGDEIAIAKVRLLFQIS